MNVKPIDTKNSCTPYEDSFTFLANCFRLSRADVLRILETYAVSADQVVKLIKTKGVLPMTASLRNIEDRCV